MPYVWFLVICSIWGSSFILMKRGADVLSPAAVSAGRIGFGAAVIGLLLLRLWKPWQLRRQDLWPLIAVMVTGFALPYTIQPWLIAKHQNSAFIGMTVAFTPLLTLGVSTIVLKSWPTPRQLIGVCGALACLMMLMWEGWQRHLTLFDLGLAMSVPLAYAVANTWIRRYLSHVSSVELTFACLAGSLVFVLPFAIAAPSPSSSGPDPTSAWSAWGAVAFLGIIGTGVATVLFTRMVVQQGPLFATMVTNLVPLGAMTWGWLDGEVITPRQMAAMLGVLSMVAVVQYRAASPSPAAFTTHDDAAVDVELVPSAETTG